MTRRNSLFIFAFITLFFLEALYFLHWKPKFKTKLHPQPKLLFNVKAKIQNKTVPNYSLHFERLRRRVGNDIKEMWLFVSDSYSKLIKKITNESRKEFEDFIENFGEMYRITETDYEDLMVVDGAELRRGKIASKLSELIQKRLHSLQNPKDCKNARKLVCVWKKGCGLGCLVHHVLGCFMIAYATQRTLVFEDKGWGYSSSKGWSSYFSHVSDSCTHFNNPVRWGVNHEQIKEVLFRSERLSPEPKQIPQNVPKEFYNRIQLFHGYPFVWWIGQFVKYLFRYPPNVREEIEQRKQRMNFTGPIVGVHVRRTDKLIWEAKYHGIEEYMHWVELYYEKLQLKQKVDRKRVFLATDDSTVITDAQKKYPNYEFLTDAKVTKKAEKERFTDMSLIGIISDIELLSETDFVVCTFSSNVCRLVYEIMNNKHTDASQLVKSLDNIYHFQWQRGIRKKALWPHQGKDRNEISFKKGDIIGVGVEANHWNGRSEGIPPNSKRKGLFPSYKVEHVHDFADFPTYHDDKN